MATHFTIDKKGFKHAAKQMDKLANAMDYARRDYVNAMAFEARKGWVSNIQGAFVLRNKFTQNSVRVEKARVAKGAVIESRVGSTAPYMDEQEDGGTKRKKGKHGSPIPTTSAAGQGMKAKPRTRQVTGRNRLGAIRLGSRVSGNRQRRNTVAILMAVKRGTNLVYLDLGRRQGIFRIMGGKRGLRVRMLWDLSRASVDIPATPTLEPALRAIPEAQRTRMGIAAMKGQLKRNKLLGF